MKRAAGLVLLSFCGWTLSASPAKIRAGAEIMVEAYLPKYDAFAVELVNEPGVGPNRVTPEGLHQAVEFNEPLATFVQQLKRHTESVFVLKNDLPLLSEAELKKRKPKKP